MDENMAQAITSYPLYTDAMKILSYITHKILVTLLRQLLPIALGALMDSVLRGVHSLSDSVDEMELGVGGKSALDDAKEDEEDLYLPPFCECHGMHLSFANLYLTVTLITCSECSVQIAF
jgi:hypothetical protein